jgi:hypothetical protein
MSGLPVVDSELWVRAWLDAQLTARVVTDTPADLAGQVPLVQVARIGGGDDSFILDRPMVSIHGFGVDRAAARAVGYQARTALFAAVGVVFQGAVVTRVSTVGGPAITPYDNTDVRRSTGTYELRIKPA